MSEPISNNIRGLCYRCEQRARYHETRDRKYPHRPRMQCGTEGSVYSCYMYRPVVPIVLGQDQNDIRPQFGPSMISSRSHPVRLAEGRLLAAVTAANAKLRAAKAGEDGNVLYWDCSAEELTSTLVIWLPFRYRLVLLFRAEMLRTDRRMWPVRMFYRLSYWITDLKDSTRDWIIEKYYGAREE